MKQPERYQAGIVKDRLAWVYFAEDIEPLLVDLARVTQERDALKAFVKALAAEPICSDAPADCSDDSGPYCGTHVQHADVVEDARKVLALVDQ